MNYPVILYPADEGGYVAEIQNSWPIAYLTFAILYLYDLKSCVYAEFYQEGHSERSEESSWFDWSYRYWILRFAQNDLEILISHVLKERIC